MNPLLEALLFALLIFSLRIIDVSLAVVRILSVVRGFKALAWVIGFFQALVFVTAIGQVLSDLGNWFNIIGYSAGFATGNVVGILLEERLAIGYGHVRIISSGHGVRLSDSLRGKGYAVTVIAGHGRDGAVDILSCAIPRRKVQPLKQLVNAVDPGAFITVENVRPLTRGYWRR